jgi:hypothetical protein
MLALLTTLFFMAPVTPAQAAVPAYTIDQVVERMTTELAGDCQFEADDVTRRRAEAAVYTIKTKATKFTPEHTYQLFELLCITGAYNEGKVYYVASEYNAPQLVTFAEPVFGAGKKAYVIGGFITNRVLLNPGFEPKTMSLGFFAKGRGVGDCFSNGAYKFKDGQFVLKSYSIDNECDGKIKARKILNYK